MLEPRQLDLLLNLARTKTDGAAYRFVQLRTAQASASAELVTLEQQREAYLRQLNGRLAGGSPVSQVRDFQDFIRALDSAIEQQRAQALQADVRLGQGRVDWQGHQQRQKAFDMLAYRASQCELGRARKKEQRDQDGHVARQGDSYAGKRKPL